MIHEATEMDASHPSPGLKAAELPEKPSPAEVVPSLAEESAALPGAMARVRPELRKALEESWKQNEAAYRHLGQ